MQRRAGRDEFENTIKFAVSSDAATGGHTSHFERTHGSAAKQCSAK